MLAVWPSPKLQKTGRSRSFLWPGFSSSIFRWFHLCQFSCDIHTKKKVNYHYIEWNAPILSKQVKNSAPNYSVCWEWGVSHSTKQAMLCHSTWESSDLSRFWHNLHQGSIGSPRIRAQSYRTDPRTYTQDASRTHKLSPVFPTNGL